MKKLSSLIIIFLALMLSVSVSCAEPEAPKRPSENMSATSVTVAPEPSLAPGISTSGTNGTHTPIKEIQGSSVDPAAPDALMPTPGFGPVYRANLHEQGVQNPWPPIEISEAYLGSGSDNVSVLFRENIKTAAGESRNNIIRVTISSEDIKSLSLYADDIPAGIKLTIGSEWRGPLSNTKSLLLVIEISSDLAPGEYPLEIDLEINGKDYGTIPCTIEVLEP